MALWAEREVLYRSTDHRGSDVVDAVRLIGGEGGRYLFTAAHSVRSLRGGTSKPADVGTGGLAETLAVLTHGAALTAIGRQTGDPNWDTTAGDFKRRVLDLESRVVLDLHGLREDRPEDLIIGLGPSPNDFSWATAARLLASARSQGLQARTGPPFDATWPGTITATVQAAGGTAMQIEVGGRRRRPLSRPDDALPLLAALLEALDASARHLEAGAQPRLRRGAAAASFRICSHPLPRRSS